MSQELKIDILVASVEVKKLLKQLMNGYDIDIEKIAIKNGLSKDRLRGYLNSSNPHSYEGRIRQSQLIGVLKDVGVSVKFVCSVNNKFVPSKELLKNSLNL